MRRCHATAALIVLFAGCAGAASERSTVKIDHAYVAPATGDPTRAYAYLTLTSDAEDDLVTVVSHGAVRASLQSSGTGVAVGGHQGHLDGDATSHRTQPAVTVHAPGGQSVVLKPGGDYILLTGLTASSTTPLDLTLRFKSGASVDLTLPTDGLTPRG
jgi:copper(I)-binding protein